MGRATRRLWQQQQAAESPCVYPVAACRSHGGGPSAVASNGLLNNLLAYWTLNEASGSRADSSGNSKTMVQTGSVTGASGFGNVGNVSVWNGNAANYLKLASLLFNSGSWTAAGWFDPGAAGSNQNIWCQGQFGFSPKQAARLNASLVLQITANGTFLTGTTTLTAATWYHVALTYNGTTVAAYLNGSGSAEVSGAQSAVYASEDTTALGISTNPTAPINGPLVGWGVWSAVLSAAKISALYNTGNGLAFSSFTT